MTAAEALERFERWFKRAGHWIYVDREQAMRVWRERGIEGLPPWKGDR